MQPFITWSVTFTLLKFKFESKGPARVLRGGPHPVYTGRNRVRDRCKKLNGDRTHRVQTGPSVAVSEAAGFMGSVR